MRKTLTLLVVGQVALSIAAFAQEVDFPAEGRPKGRPIESNGTQTLDAEATASVSVGGGGSGTVQSNQGTETPLAGGATIRGEAGLTSTSFENRGMLGDKSGIEFGLTGRLRLDPLSNGEHRHDIELGNVTLWREAADEEKAFGKPIGAGAGYQTAQRQQAAPGDNGFGQRYDVQLVKLTYQNHNHPLTQTEYSGADLAVEGGYGSRHGDKHHSFDWCLAAKAQAMPYLPEHSRVAGRKVDGAEVGGAIKGCAGVQIGETAHVGVTAEGGVKRFETAREPGRPSEPATVTNATVTLSADKLFSLPISVINTHELETASAGSANSATSYSTFLMVEGGF